MVKRTECSEPSGDEQSYSSSYEEWSVDADEIVEVNGFQVLDSQEIQVKAIFEKHPDIASDFNLKNEQLKNAYMGVLLDLIMTLCRSPKELTMDDLNEADDTLWDLTNAGLKLHWLRQKLDETFLKKEKKMDIRARIRELEEQFMKGEFNFSEFESELKKLKAEALPFDTPFDFNDFV